MHRPFPRQYMEASTQYSVPRTQKVKTFNRRARRVRGVFAFNPGIRRSGDSLLGTKYWVLDTHSRTLTSSCTTLLNSRWWR
jgi:hypothetical protein